MAQFSLSWDAQKNIYQGLTALQQNGEFVDMTLAADGHLVKVHQMVIALASPYLKELIASANCRYPVIFLNKVSYTILCSILEYVYMGEVLVEADQLQNFLQAARELHIKGISEMSVQQCASNMENEEDEVFFQIESTTNDPEDTKDQEYIMSAEQQEAPVRMVEEALSEVEDDSMLIDPAAAAKIRMKPPATTKQPPEIRVPEQVMQYTVSNQGSLQMILNRFIYFVKHANKRATQWRCVDYISKQARCPAYVITEDEVVVKRVGIHTHSFHDKRIMKKLRNGAVYSAIQEAKQDGSLMRQNRRVTDTTDVTDAADVTNTSATEDNAQSITTGDV